MGERLVLWRTCARTCPVFFYVLYRTPPSLQSLLMYELLHILHIPSGLVILFAFRMAELLFLDFVILADTFTAVL